MYVSYRQWACNPLQYRDKRQTSRPTQKKDAIQLSTIQVQTVKNANGIDVCTPKAAGKALGVDPKAIRRFMRKMAEKRSLETPGRGGSWEIPAPDGDLTKFAEAFRAGVSSITAATITFSFEDDAEFGVNSGYDVDVDDDSAE